jgi:hypothetical protein
MHSSHISLFFLINPLSDWIIKRLSSAQNSTFPSSNDINHPIVEEKAKSTPPLNENRRRKKFFFSFFRSSLKEMVEKVSPVAPYPP